MVSDYRFDREIAAQQNFRPLILGKVQDFLLMSVALVSRGACALHSLASDEDQGAEGGDFNL